MAHVDTFVMICDARSSKLLAATMLQSRPKDRYQKRDHHQLTSK